MRASTTLEGKLDRSKVSELNEEIQGLNLKTRIEFFFFTNPVKSLDNSFGRKCAKFSLFE